MSNDNQLRQPAGTPVGGQYAADPNASASAPVQLPVPQPEPINIFDVEDDDEYNADASFLFPPVPRSLRQHLKFWMRVPIDDHILYSVKHSYNNYRQKVVADAKEGAELNWNANKRKLSKEGYTRETYISSGIQLAIDEAPMKINDVDIRNIVRAELALGISRGLSDEEHAQLREHKVYIAALGRELSLQEIHETYNIARFVIQASTPPDVELPSLTRQVLQATSELVAVQRRHNDFHRQTLLDVYYK